MTSGQKLKQDLGLSPFKYIYIRRMLGRSPRIYHVYLDTYLSGYKITPTEVKTYESCQILGVASNKNLQRIKFTLPQLLEDFDEPIGSRDVFFVFDAAGEYKYKPRDYDVKTQEPVESPSLTQRAITSLAARALAGGI